jgi:hypothetical protein
MRIYLAILSILLAYAIWVFVVAMQNFDYATAEASAETIEIELHPKQFNLKYSPKEQYLLSIGMVDLAKVDSTFIIDLIYNSDQNFTGRILYSDVNSAFLQSIIAERVKTAQAYLKSIHPNFSLVIFDAARPVSVQNEMWNWAVENNKQQYVADPSRYLRFTIMAVQWIFLLWERIVYWIWEPQLIFSVRRQNHAIIGNCCKMEI